MNKQNKLITDIESFLNNKLLMESIDRMEKQYTLTADIESFLKEKKLINFLDELGNYADFLKKVLLYQEPQATKILNNPGLEKEYRRYQKILPKCMKEIKEMLSEKKLDKERMHSFYNFYDKKENKRKTIKPEYAGIFGFIKVTSFFIALTCSHLNQKLDLTLEQRIKQLQKLHPNLRQSFISDLKGMKNISNTIQRQIPEKVA